VAQQQAETMVLTLTEVAALLRVPKSTVYKLAQHGRVPAFKVGKHWRFLQRDIEGWLVGNSGKSVEGEREGPP
jgi:excisionase family DNA binding protein